MNQGNLQSESRLAIELGGINYPETHIIDELLKGRRLKEFYDGPVRVLLDRELLLLDLQREITLLNHRYLEQLSSRFLLLDELHT